MKRRFERLLGGHFDLLIVGGGIYGAWAAYDAAMRGLSVALVEREDWAAGTSMSSSKLIHGGLRYLERLELGLVRKSLSERRLLAQLAPHRVTPLRFAIPIFADSRVGKWRMRAGLWLYDRLAGDDQPVDGHGALNRKQMLEEYPFLEPRGLKGGLTYGDCQTDDARFTLEIVAGAMHFGAVAVNRVEVVELFRTSSRIDGARLRDRETEAEVKVTAEAVINCAGPWVQKVLRTAEPKAEQLTRLSKGVHLVMPPLATGDAFLKIASGSGGGGVVFLIPWYGRTLLGTTDTDYKGAPGFERAEHRDVTYLLDQANRMLGNTHWEQRDIIGTFAGLRTLPFGGGRSPSKVSREWTSTESVEGLLTSVGGKYTSARADAGLAVDRAIAMLKRDPLPCATTDQPFPWAPRDEEFSDWFGSAISSGIGLGLDEETAETCARRYGIRVVGLFDILRGDASLVRRILPGAPFCLGEVDHAVQNEMARTLLDVVRRRIPLVLVERVDVNTLKTITDRIGNLLNWDAARREAEFLTVGARMRPAKPKGVGSGAGRNPSGLP